MSNNMIVTTYMGKRIVGHKDVDRITIQLDDWQRFDIKVRDSMLSISAFDVLTIVPKGSNLIYLMDKELSNSKGESK